MKWSEVQCESRVYGPFNENERAVRGAFLCALGIDLENLPPELFEPCKKYAAKPGALSAEYEGRVHIKEIVGTRHSVYGGQTWLYAFMQEHKTMLHLLNGSVTRGKYFRMLKKPICDQPPYIHLIRTKAGAYYVYGNGNHRVTFYKLMYLADLSNRKNNLHLYWLNAMIQDEL